MTGAELVAPFLVGSVALIAGMVVATVFWHTLFRIAERLYKTRSRRNHS